MTDIHGNFPHIEQEGNGQGDEARFGNVQRLRVYNQHDRRHGKMNGEDGHAEYGGRRSSVATIFRYLGWWFGFSGLYGAFGVCPCCGRVGCPVEGVSAGIIGAFLALCMMKGKRLMSRERGVRRCRVKRKKGR